MAFPSAAPGTNSSTVPPSPSPNPYPKPLSASAKTTRISGQTTTVGSLLITSLLFSVAIVGAHSAFRVPEDFYFEEQQAQAQAPTPASSIISMLTGAATNAAAAPPTAVRV
nr:PRA1 family protein B4-like [Ipomoea batatas]